MADDFQDLKDQFNQMHTDLDKLGGGASKAQIKDRLRDEKGRFVKMNKGLDKLVEATKTQTKITQEQTKAAKKQNEGIKISHDHAKVQSTDRKSVLKAMQLQLRKTQMAQGASMADVAAEHLAGGGGLMGAGKAAAGLKVGQLKHKFDPLNIIKKLTGGSKLAVALSGRLMGRSEKSIRSFADLAPGMDLPTPFFGKSKGFGSPSREFGEGGRGASQVGSDRSLPLLVMMVKSLKRIEGFEDERLTLAREEADRLRDRDALDKAGRQKTPTQLTKTGKDKKDEGKTLWETIMGWLGKLGGVVMSLAGGLAGLLNPIGLLSRAFGSILTTLGVSRGVSALAGGAIKLAKAGGAAVAKGGAAIVGGIKSLGEKVLGTAGKAAADAGGKLAAGRVPGTLAEAKELGMASKTAPAATKATEQVASKGKIAGVLGKLAPKVLGSRAAMMIPAVGSAVGLAFAASRLLQGDLIGAGIDAAGILPIPGAAIPSIVASLVRDAYMEIYNADPFTDPLNKERLPSLMAMAKESVSDWLSGEAKTKEGSPTAVSDEDAAAQLDSIMGAQSAPGAAPAVPGAASVLGSASSAPSAPTELSAIAPSTGQQLAQANENSRNSEMLGEVSGSTGGSATVINNVKNNNSVVNNLQQTMPDPRSGESSYLRSLDRHTVPA